MPNNDAPRKAKPDKEPSTQSGSGKNSGPNPGPIERVEKGPKSPDETTEKRPDTLKK